MGHANCPVPEISEGFLGDGLILRARVSFIEQCAKRLSIEVAADHSYLSWMSEIIAAFTRSSRILQLQALDPEDR